MTGEEDHGRRYGGFGPRAVAFVIDAIITGIIFLALLEGAALAGKFTGRLFFAGMATPFREPGMTATIARLMALVVLFVLLCWLYSAGMTSSRYRATFGKMILGLTVTDVFGDRLSFRHATIRFIAKVFSGLILLIGFFMIQFSPTRQGLHDRFAGTYVIAREAPAPSVP
jgi:uncharacterized RDD family membrane protein YckC